MNINPVYWLDLRTRSREQRLWIIAVFFTITLLIVTGIVLSTIAFHDNDYTTPDSIGNGLIWATLVIHAGILIILSPLAAAGRIASEREQRTWAALANSPLARSRIALGKLLGAWTFVLWIGCIAMPFLSVGCLWGGPQPEEIARCFLANLFVGMTLATVALGFSGFFGRSLTAYIATGAFLFAWIVVAPLFGLLLITTLNSHNTEAAYEVISYIAFFHHPLYPLFSTATQEALPRFTSPETSYIYCFSVWTVMNLIGFAMATAGLKKELY